MTAVARHHTTISARRLWDAAPTPTDGFFLIIIIFIAIHLIAGNAAPSTESR